MTQENKESLLLRYLCSILPYKVIVSCAEGTVMGIHWNKVKLDVSLLFELQENGALSYVKPYLRSMDSMNEEEVIEFNNIPSTKNYQIVKGDLPWDVANYLNYTLYDRVEIKNPGKIIPSLCAKGEFIEDFKNYMKGE